MIKQEREIQLMENLEESTTFKVKQLDVDGKSSLGQLTLSQTRISLLASDNLKVINLS